MNNEIILTKKNIHRAKTVEKDGRTYDIRFLIEGGLRKVFVAVGERTIEWIRTEPPEELQKWTVKGWKSEIALDELYEDAVRSVKKTSPYPEEVANGLLECAERSLSIDLEDIPGDEREYYITGYMNRYKDLLLKKAEIASVLIVGVSNFNVRENEKNINIAEKARKDFNEWRRKVLDASKKKKNRLCPIGSSDEWEDLKKEIFSTAKTIEEINNGQIKGYDKARFVASIYNKTFTFAKAGKVEIVREAIKFVRSLNRGIPKPIITEAHSFFRLGEMAEKARKGKESVRQRENVEERFDGGRAVINYKAEVVEIIFDDKAGEDTRTKLKKGVYHWSPTCGSWQRKLTPEALRSIGKVVEGLKYDEEKEILKYTDCPV